MQRKSLLLVLLALPFNLVSSEDMPVLREELTPRCELPEQIVARTEEAPVVTTPVVTEQAPQIDETAVVEVPVVTECDALTQAIIEAAPSTSLMSSRPNIFSVGTFFSLDTVTDPDAAYSSSLNKPLGFAVTYKLAKKTPERYDWTAVKVLRQTKYIYGSNLKFDTKYEGFRDTVVGYTLEKLLFLTKKHKGTFLIDEYKNYPLWNVVLKDVVELREFLTYLETCLEKKNMKSFDQKPVIRLILADDVLLQTIELNDWIRLKTQFDIVHPCDITTVTYFDASKFTMDDLIMRASNNKPFEPGRGMGRSLMDKLEDTFYSFKTADIMSQVVVVGGAVFVGSIFLGYWNELVDKALEKIGLSKKQVGEMAIKRLADMLKK
jgi:hypothetical protein